MKQKDFEQFVEEYGKHVASTIDILCHTSVEGDWKTKVTIQIGGGSWCACDHNKHTITIQIGVPEWLGDGDPNRARYLAVLGFEPGEEQVAAYCKGLGGHELGHAYLTRPGNTIKAIARSFKLREPNPSRYKQEFFNQQVEQLIHFFFNCVEDAREENIFSNIFNFGEYFNFMRLMDYMVATDAGNAPRSWIFGYALLQVGVIGRYPQFPVEPECKKAIEAILHQKVPGSKKERNLYDEFLCEPHPTISVKMFARWFDIPEVREYVSQLIYDEIETQCKAAEQLAKMLANMPQEVTVTGGGGGGGIPLKLPSNIKIKRAMPDNKQDEDEESSDGNGSGTGKKSDEESKNKNGSSAGAGDDENSEEKQKSTGGKDGEGEDADGQNGNQDGSNGSSNADGENGDANGSSSNKNQSGQPSGDDNPVDEETFDENGNWQLNKSSGEAEERDPLKEMDDLRKALDDTIKEIAKATSASIKSQKIKTAKVKKTKQNKSNSGVTIDTSFVPTKLPPKKVVEAAKPLRSVIKKIFSENNDEEVVGLKAGHLNTQALYRYKNKDLSIFKVNRLPTVMDAVYYICWDGSGSMYGAKQSESAYACAVIEEAVRGIYPLKIINFSTHGDVVHYVVKDFDDKTKKNCAYSFGATRNFGGGNKDGFSIRQCTEELIKRKETNKFLIVLSDGAPSDYNSHEEAVADVKSAVAFARQNKIDVTSIFFGTQREREAEIELYNEMYGAGHIISCEPSAIVNHMVQIVKKNILKR